MTVFWIGVGVDLGLYRYDLKIKLVATIHFRFSPPFFLLSCIHINVIPTSQFPEMKWIFFLSHYIFFSSTR